MSMPQEDPSRTLRWSVYWILITLAVGNMAGRILSVSSVDYARLETHRYKEKFKAKQSQLIEQGLEGDALEAELEAYQQKLEAKEFLQRPFLSSNDRSRWATIRALVEHGTYSIDEIVEQRQWDTIDMVKHKDREGVPRLYSSKPPLLPTLIAGEYWLIHKLTGATLGTHPFAIGRFMVITINVIPLALMFYLLAQMVEKLGKTDWSRIFVMGCATLATFLTTFAVVLNNHIVGAVSATVAIYAVLRIVMDGERQARFFIVAGLFAAFTAANELPALSFLGLVSLVLLWKVPRPTLTWFVPAVLLVGGAFFATNKIAHNTFKPPYAFRSDTNPDDNWYRYTFIRGGKERKSYWYDPQGIDSGETSRATYVWNVLIGHHGIFSLTPIWLLSIIGVGMGLMSRDPHRRGLAIGVALLTIVCLTFYLMRPEQDRNYGGMTSAFRWMFWFAPMWLLTMLPAADAMAPSRWKRHLGHILLGLSVLSASFPTWNPWTHPWITRYYQYMDWIDF